jgi:hypothetical protein
MIINNGSNSARYIDRHSGYDLSGIDLQSASISRAGSVHIAEASPRGVWVICPHLNICSLRLSCYIASCHVECFNAFQIPTLQILRILSLQLIKCSGHYSPPLLTLEHPHALPPSLSLYLRVAPRRCPQTSSVPGLPRAPQEDQGTHRPKTHMGRTGHIRR